MSAQKSSSPAETRQRTGTDRHAASPFGDAPSETLSRTRVGAEALHVAAIYGNPELDTVRPAGGRRRRRGDERAGVPLVQQGDV